MTTTIKNSHKLSKRKKCLIWTRVSTIEQEHSLDAQLESCKTLAKELGFDTIVVNNPVSESAKEAGEAFKEMLKKVKDSRQGFDGIIIEYADRLSRNLPTASHQVRELRKKGIYTYSVSEGLNTENMEDIFRADGYFSRAERDNYLRTQKTKNGTIYWLRQGYHMGKPPIGYQRRLNIPKSDVRSKEIIQTDDARLIAEAFRLLNSGVQIKNIQKSLSVKGLDVSTKRWGEILRNPIYIGVIKNKALNRQNIQGKHEPIISKITFDKAQHILSKNKKVKSTNEVDEIILKGNIQCCNCGNELTAYEKRKKKKTYYYYKCYNKGCSNNISTKTVNDSFMDNLSRLELNNELKDNIKDLISELYDDVFSFELKSAAKTKEEISKLEKRIERCEEDYYDELISRDKMNEKVSLWQEKINSLTTQLNDIMVISKEELVTSTLHDLDNFTSLFESLPYQEKKQVLNLLHGSISYDRDYDILRTGNLIALFKVG